MDKSLADWVIFLSLIIILLIIDLGIFARENKEISPKKSIYLSLFYIILGLAFGLFIYKNKGQTAAAEYYIGFLVEKTLALDNIFLISLVFSYFNIERKYQHRVLFWGIIGVLVLRAIIIYVGATIVKNYSWVLYVFGAILIYTGIKMLIITKTKPKIENSLILKFLQKILPITDKLEGDKFFISLPTKNGGSKIFVTRLFIALLLIEFIDLIFAIDSLPAIFAITNEPYIIYTSNIFAILGLRALYFALDAVLAKFYYLKYSLAIILVFIGSKIFIADILGIAKFPAEISLLVTGFILAAGVIYSLFRPTLQKPTS